MYVYAEIDENGICIGISEHDAEIRDENHISIGSFDVGYCGKKYENGSWIEIENDVEEPAFSVTDYAEMTYINSEYTVALLEALM